jgi:integrase
MPKKKLLRSAWPRVRRILHHGHERFLVDCRPTGKREIWSDSSDALAAAERIALQRKNDGAASFAELSPGDRRDASEALSILPEDVTLLDAARAFMREKERVEVTSIVPTVNEAVDQYLATKRAEMDKGEFARLSYSDLVSKLNPVRRELGHRKVTELTEAGAADFISGLALKPAGRLNVRTKLSQLLRFCVRKGWIQSNPVATVKIRVKAKDVEILDVSQVRRLLFVAGQADPVSGVFPYMVLQLFAGLRPHEAAQMHWEYMHFETGQVEVKAATSKTRESRFVALEPVITEMLLPYRRLAGPIVGRNFERTVPEVRAAAGFGPGKWTKDVLRHCYGSYWLAVHKDRAHLAELMGNSIAVIRRHYRRAIPEAIAKEFWSISVEPMAAKVIPISEKLERREGSV